MPCHPDRVRRNYHDITIQTRENFETRATEVRISITRQDVATAMSARELKHAVLKRIGDGIDEMLSGEVTTR